MFKELTILRIFFEEPNSEFHLRQLARLLKKNPVTVKNYLKEHVLSGAIGCKKERGLELYSANAENFYFKEYKRVYNKFRLIESGLLDFLKKEFSLPTIILFGSYERGEDNKNSDIDIFILSETKRQVSLEEYEAALKRTIQVHFMSRKEFKNLKKSNPGLINSIINGSVLNGFIEVL